MDRVWLNRPHTFIPSLKITLQMMAYKIMINGEAIIYNMPEISTIYPASGSYKYIPLPRTTSVTHCLNSDSPEADMRHGLICKPLMKEKHWERPIKADMANKMWNGSKSEGQTSTKNSFMVNLLQGPGGICHDLRKGSWNLMQFHTSALSEELFQEGFKFPGTSGSYKVLQDKLNHP